MGGASAPEGGGSDSRGLEERQAQLYAFGALLVRGLEAAKGAASGGGCEATSPQDSFAAVINAVGNILQQFGSLRNMFLDELRTSLSELCKASKTMEQRLAATGKELSVLKEEAKPVDLEPIREALAGIRAMIPENFCEKFPEMCTLLEHPPAAKGPEHETAKEFLECPECYPSFSEAASGTGANTLIGKRGKRVRAFLLKISFTPVTAWQLPAIVLNSWQPLGKRGSEWLPAAWPGVPGTLRRAANYAHNVRQLCLQCPDVAAQASETGSDTLVTTKSQIAGINDI